MPAPIHIEASDRAPIDQSPPWAEGELSLVVEADGGSCTFARTDAQQQVRLLDRALWDWMEGSGRRVSLSITPMPPCDGLPSIEAAAVPESGWLIGLVRPPESVRLAPSGSDDAISAKQVGEDGRWWLVSRRGEGSLVAMHGNDPPTRIAMRFDDGLAPIGLLHAPPNGGAFAVELSGDPTDVTVSDSTIASAQLDGRWLVLVGRAPGETSAAIRRKEGPPEILRVETGPVLSPSPRELRVPVGRSRRYVLEDPPDSAWIADPSAASAEIKGARVRLEGLAPGRTHLVIRQGAMLFLVPVAVGR